MSEYNYIFNMLPRQVLLNLLEEEKNLNWLCRSFEKKKKTANIKKIVNRFVEDGLLYKEDDGYKKPIRFTARGKRIAYELQNFYYSLGIREEEKNELLLGELTEYRTKMFKINSNSYFDLDVIKNMDRSLKKSEKLKILVSSIVKNREFLADDILEEYNEIFPFDKLEKTTLIGYFYRFKDKKNKKNYIKGFKRVRNSTYVIEK